MADDTQNPNPDLENEPSDYQKPEASKNPRDIAMAEIAKRVADQHTESAAETMDSIDEDGNVTAAQPAESQPPVETTAEQPEQPASTSSSSEEPEVPAAAAPGEEAIDPTKDYEVTVDGQKLTVKGKAIIDAGYRTFQKEAAADLRLKMAEELLRESEIRAEAARRGGSSGEPAPSQPPAKPADKTDAELAKAIQFGTPEEAEGALKTLRGRGLDQQQILGFVQQASRVATRDEFLFQEGMKFVREEFKDLLANDYLKRLFYSEENRYRAPKERGGLGDARPYKDVYEEIGNNLRKAFNIPKPGAVQAAPNNPSTSTAKGRQAVKASTPPIPRSAASRLSEVDKTAKAKTPSEIIAGMAERRGQNRLTPSRKE